MIERVELNQIAGDRPAACYQPELFSWDNPDLPASIPHIAPLTPAAISPPLDPLAQAIWSTELDAEGTEALLQQLGVPAAEERLLAYLSTTPASEDDAIIARQELVSGYGDIFRALVSLEREYDRLPSLGQKCRELREQISRRLFALAPELAAEHGGRAVELIDEIQAERRAAENPTVPPAYAPETARYTASEDETAGAPLAPFRGSPIAERADPLLDRPRPPEPPREEPADAPDRALARLNAAIEHNWAMANAVGRENEHRARSLRHSPVEEGITAGRSFDQSITRMSDALYRDTLARIERSSREAQAGEVVRSADIS